jgi:hypothetical protein
VCRCGAKKCRGYIVGEEHAAELKEWLEKQAEAAALEKAHHHAPRAKRRKA